MSTKVLLSIRPEFADAIFEGKKRFEYRKARFKQGNVVTIFVYSSSPVRKVIGEFTPSSFLSSEPDQLWASTKEYAGISKDFFDSYFEGKEIGYAIEVGRTRRYAVPKSLQDMFSLDRPPQSFQYVD